jgi:hypothetical protein
VLWSACGGKSEKVDMLRNVRQIHATRLAFAALLADRSVVTGGISKYGGDSSKVQDQLRNVAAILADQTLVMWGYDTLDIENIQGRISLM